MSQAVLYVTCGLPGAGKTTWARATAHGTGAVLVTSDPVRAAHAPPGGHFARMYAVAAKRLREGRSVIFDACSLREDERLKLQRLGEQAGARCVLVVFCTPWRECVARDEARGQEGTHMSTGAWFIKRGLMARALSALRHELWDEVLYVPEQLPAARFLWGGASPGTVNG